MGRQIEINPVTRIEGHAKVLIDLADDGTVADAILQVLEFRGFERFVQGMQVELMPTLTTRICGTCPHAHHLAAAKAVDRVFGVEPPRAALLLRQLLNAGSMIHSHAIHFFALAGPDLLLGLDAPAEKRNLVSLLESSPEIAKSGLRLRSIGQRIAEEVGGRGTHPVTCVAGGVSAPLAAEARERLQRLAAEAVELAQFALDEGKAALAQNSAYLDAFSLKIHDLGTVREGTLDLYDGVLRAQRPDGSLALEFVAEEYREILHEEALPFTYAKQVRLRDPELGDVEYRVGPLARLNCADVIDTPRAAEEFGRFRERWGRPCSLTVLGHFARLIELMHHAEKAQVLLADDEIVSSDVRRRPEGTPVRGVAHVEAPRGVLIHDYEVDQDGVVERANFLVATQHNLSGINQTVRAAAERFVGGTDEQLLGGVEFAIRCYDPCLSCSTHQLGKMPLVVHVRHGGKLLREVRR